MRCHRSYTGILSILTLLQASVMIAQEVNYARDLVNPFIGTGGHGHTFPGACVPNGLVQLSPDTRPDPVEWDGCGGYHYSDSVIYGFSHTHLSGTGVADLCDVLLMPMSGTYSLDPSEYRSRFSHGHEQAHAGYYNVHLLDEHIDVELTATPRTGMHRYTFEQDEDAWVVLDLDHRDRLTDASVALTGTNEIVGERSSSSWATDQRLFYCIQFDRPIVEHKIEGNKAAFQLLRQLPPTSMGLGVLHTPRTDQIQVKVGISAVSIEGARRNLEAEIPGWDFDKVQEHAETAWNNKLSKINVKGGTRGQQRVFYTALYHSYIAPCIFNDVDGRYRGMDGEVHHAEHPVYTVFSLWDTFRALHPLMTILEPKMTSDWIRTFLLHYQQGGKLPVWELWGNETDCMIGYHSVSVIADAHMKGIRDLDVDLALEAMVASAMADDPCLSALRTRGFISSEDCAESVSKTLEYAYDNACIATLMNALGDRAPQEQYAIRRLAENHKSLFDPAVGFFRARRNGGFIPGFDPYEVNFNFTEANAWQYSLFAPQDIDGLILMFGSGAALERHLDELFIANEETTGREQADISGLIGQYAHGNEPSHHMAYLYDRVGRPEKTRAVVKRIMEEMYQDAPDGLSGNEDCGQMSAWFVMSALGMYQVSPGIDANYSFGYPLFDRASIRLPDGGSWSIAVTDEFAQRANVPEDTLAMIGYYPKQLSHHELLQGGEILFGMDRAPLKRYVHASSGLGPAPVRAVEVVLEERPGAPLINAPAASFAESMEVFVHGRGTCSITDLSGKRSCPMNAPFTISTSSTVEVAWSYYFSPVTAYFTKIDNDRSIDLESSYANQYAAGGNKALIDGIRGSSDFRTGDWQGYQGQDVLATIDLGTIMTLDSIGIGMLQDMRSWIWYPEYVDVAWSSNKRQWGSTVLVPNESRQREGGLKMDLWSGPIGKKARYIKIMAKNPGPCPPWHLGAGGASWIFLDEVLIEAH